MQHPPTHHNRARVSLFTPTHPPSQPTDGGGGEGGGGEGGSDGGARLSPAAIAVLRGDALVSAHYRLGIGVNAAFRTLRGWQELLRGVWATGGAVDLRGGEGAAVGGAAVGGAAVGGDGGGGEAAALLRAYEEVP